MSIQPSTREKIILIGLFGLSSLIYFTIAQTVENPTVVVMPAWVPFLPILAIPYLLQVVGSYVLVIAVRDRTRRHASVKAYFTAFMLTCAVWYFHPTVMARPAVPPGWWNWPFGVMAGLDLPVNVVPAGHVLMPVIICWAFWHDRRDWLWWLVPAELVGTVAIVTTWQHRPIDVVSGVVLAIVMGLIFGVGKQRELA